MKNLNLFQRHFAFGFVSVPSGYKSKLTRVWSTFWLLVVLTLAPAFETSAQSGRPTPIRIGNVATQTSAGNTVVSIAADSSLERAQTWQDNDGYHVIVPYASAQSSVKSSSGLKVRRVGQSLEILIQTAPGASVSSQLEDNRLNLTVYGRLEPRPEPPITSSTNIDDNSWSAASAAKPTVEVPRVRLASAAEDLSFNSQFPTQSYSSNTKAGPPALQPRSNQEIAKLQKPAPVAPESEIELQPEEDGVFASIFSSTSVLVILALGIFGLLVSRKLRSRHAPKDKIVENDSQEFEEWEDNNPQQRSQSDSQKSAPDKKQQSLQPALVSRVSSHMTVATPDSLYGAYRIDQEVGKLVIGQPHRMDVLSSRAPEDRRAIEASLIKMIASSPDENERRRASEALEEYGFVARECATLIMANDPFDRTTAARSLGEIKSPAALPFLLEGLYDAESTVRNQAVASIGELKVPRAIGALLDMARRHPDVPGNLVSKALSACSVEGLDFFDATITEPAMLTDGQAGGFGFDITKLEPGAPIEPLPSASDDEEFAAALAAFHGEDISERLEAAKSLARYQVAEAVSVLTTAARTDQASSIRAQAISSLASINHESVFPAVLIGMADESREVRAAAARSLTHLSFERIDAYIHLLEATDEELVKDVARASVQSGLVSQALDRLASGDHRQIYETFALISLLAKAGQTEPVLDAVMNHANMDVRLTAVRLLTNTGELEVFEQLRELAVRDDMSEELRTALLEAMYKLDQANAEGQVEEPAPSVFTGEFLFETNSEVVEPAVADQDFAPEIQTNSDEF